MALLKIEKTGLTVPTFAEAKVGQLVIALGRPEDLQAAVSNVVAAGGPVKGQFRHLEAYIQTDVTMFPGFSGGPLVDASGQGTFLSKKLGQKRSHRDLDRVAFFCHWVNNDYDDALSQGLIKIIYLGGTKKGWIWVIPVGKDHLSIRDHDRTRRH